MHGMLNYAALQDGLSKAVHSANGRRTALYCESVAIVCLSHISIAFNLAEDMIGNSAGEDVIWAMPDLKNAT